MNLRVRKFWLKSEPNFFLYPFFFKCHKVCGTKEKMDNKKRVKTSCFARKKFSFGGVVQLAQLLAHERVGVPLKVEVIFSYPQEETPISYSALIPDRFAWKILTNRLIMLAGWFNSHVSKSRTNCMLGSTRLKEKYFIFA